MADYSYLERRREQIGMTLDDLIKGARVPYTRAWYSLKASLTPDEIRRLERVLGIERERGS